MPGTTQRPVSGPNRHTLLRFRWAAPGRVQSLSATGFSPPTGSLTQSAPNTPILRGLNSAMLILTVRPHIVNGQNDSPCSMVCCYHCLVFGVNWYRRARQITLPLGEIWPGQARSGSNPSAQLIVLLRHNPECPNALIRVLEYVGSILVEKR